MLKIRSRTLAALRVPRIPDVGRDTIGTGRVLAIKAHGPLELRRHPFAQPVNIGIGCLSGEDEDVGPHPDFDGQSQPARRLTECGTIGIHDFDEISRIESVKPDRRVWIVRDRTRLSERRIAEVCSVKAVARRVESDRPGGFPQAPITDRPFGQHDTAVLVVYSNGSYQRPAHDTGQPGSAGGCHLEELTTSCSHVSSSLSGMPGVAGGEANRASF